MGLYRNIAGLNPYNQVGLLLNLKDAFTPPITQPPTGGGLTIQDPSTVTILPAGTQWSGSNTTLQQSTQYIRNAFDALEAEMNNRYNALLANTPQYISSINIKIDSSTDNIIQCDSEGNNCSVFLELQYVQSIENAAGTAGTLFMHMGLPIIAKDTAGYAGGGRASQGATSMYSTPIAEVLAIPATPTGSNVIQDYNPPQQSVPGAPSTGGGDVATTPGTTLNPSVTTPAASNKTLSYVALGIAAIGVARSRKLLLVGGLGLLYYSMSKTQNS